MELQWPLILFTTLLTWCAGLFGFQAIAIREDKAPKTQMASWIVAAVLLVVGSLAVTFHLAQPLHIFNGFGHITSGITQELICIVILAVAALVHMVLMRKSEDGCSVPKWSSVFSVAASALLVALMSHSYVMAGRPAWNNMIYILYMLGNACVLGPATYLIIGKLCGEKESNALELTFAGAAVNAVFTVVYLLVVQINSANFAGWQYYWDPTDPAKTLFDPSNAYNVFAGDYAALVWAGAIVVGAAAPVALAALGKKGKPTSVTALTAAALVCALAGAIVVRMLFYCFGFPAINLY